MTGSKEDRELHGYGSDDYLCTTVIGGRSPMASAFGTATVRTYWLVHDACAALARGTFDSFGFDGSIRRQHSSFSTGDAWVNRDPDSTWSVHGRELPGNGFLVRAKDGTEAGVVLSGGMRMAFSKSPSGMYVEANPSGSGEKASFGGVTTDGALYISFGDMTIKPLPGRGRFSVEIDLAAVGRGNSSVASVERLSLYRDASAAKPPVWRQSGDILALACDTAGTGYRLVFSKKP